MLPEQRHITGSQIAPDTLQPHGMAPVADPVQGLADARVQSGDATGVLEQAVGIEPAEQGRNKSRRDT
ncbi:hypothetical protein [Streptomyces fructofermentans]|uniref:Uncharacterized protein n=1 Tax=Streptomyces fructofermentans TaxID=152141 RepID=A0A918NV46_9ACTN|nr:hypothetical protein [Streptomyces fructofermentans]GGX98821.1 hypothetical protein GCM10010515_76260 [Streptomyces fructofermentans]